MKIDVTKCMGCRKGISLFVKDDNSYNHVDLFATREAGATYRCENSEMIGEHLVKNGNRGTLLPNDNLKRFFDKQEAWWEDIIDLAYAVLSEQNHVTEFFNKGPKGNRVWNLPNTDIENKLLGIAKAKNIKVEAEDYPDLIKWGT